CRHARTSKANGGVRSWPTCSFARLRQWFPRGPALRQRRLTHLLGNIFGTPVWHRAIGNSITFRRPQSSLQIESMSAFRCKSGGRSLHAALELVGTLASDRKFSSSFFSLTEGASGGDVSALVAAKICCWQESPSAMIRSNVPRVQS